MTLDAGDVAVVTGAAGGIGFALAAALGRRGLRLMLADVEAPALDAAARTLARSGPVATMPVDVRDGAQFEALADRTLREYGQVDVVANIAGVAGPWGPSWDQVPEDWQWILEVNLGGAVNGVRAFVPHLVAQGHGHVITMASVAGLAPVPGGGNAPYAVSKYGIVGLSETLRAELDEVAPDVGVTVVCPGRVATRLRESDRNRPADRARRRTPAEPATMAAPAREIDPHVARPEDVADAIVAGVRAGRLFVVTDPAAARLARARAHRMLDELPPGTP